MKGERGKERGKKRGLQHECQCDDGFVPFNKPYRN